MSAPSSSHALACRRIWYRLDQIMLAGFFGKTEIPLAGNDNPTRCKLSAIFPLRLSVFVSTLEIRCLVPEATAEQLPRLPCTSERHQGSSRFAREQEGPA